jgi:hypothetical protein
MGDRQCDVIAMKELEVRWFEISGMRILGDDLLTGNLMSQDRGMWQGGIEEEVQFLRI